MTISLTGFMGCGKSSVGRRLSELLCCPFMDLDKEIEARAGKSIPEIFAEQGEAGFREIEVERLSAALAPSPYPGVEKCKFRTAVSPLQPQQDNNAMKEREMRVLSLGGGTVMREECAQMVREKTMCIYLRASIETLAEKLKHEAKGRPMLASSGSLHDRIAELLALRSPTYENTAHIIVDIDGKSLDDIAEAIIHAISSGV